MVQRLPETSTMPPTTGSFVVSDEGGVLGSGVELNFIGVGVTAALVGSRADITIPGGGGGSDTGWTAAGETWTYASATTFTVPTDLTVKYQKGTKIQLTQTTVKYFYVVASSYAAPNTTVTITAGTDYALANAAITVPCYSYMENPQGFPDIFNYTPIWSGDIAPPAIGNGTLLGTFSVVGKKIFNRVYLRAGSTTTFGTGQWRFTLPITGPGGVYYFGPAGTYDADPGVIASATGYNGSSTNGTCFTGAGFIHATSPFTWAVNDELAYAFWYVFP